MLFKNVQSILALLLIPCFAWAQDLTQGLDVNDLSPHNMQAISKPAYLESIIDPSFGTTIRRISDAGIGGVIKPMYSTIQAWNANESLMILYNQTNNNHDLLDGQNYNYIRTLTDVSPADLEQIFWDYNDPDIFYYPENNTHDFIKYHVSTQIKEVLFNMTTVTSCSGDIHLGNDVQMMSWDSDLVTFRCEDSETFSYRISTAQLTTFNISSVSEAAPGAGPSGIYFYHEKSIYDSNGNFVHALNESSVEHSSMGKLANGNDAYFAIAFAQGPNEGCIGDIIAHDLASGDCFPVISQSRGYNYPQSGTHMSANAHKNTQGGWIAASMIGYDQDGQSLLDQELVIARADQGNVEVCRIGHHRSDEDEFDYWGEPHATISPTGTRVLFGSDWSGVEDGQSVDSYVVELPSYVSNEASADAVLGHDCIKLVSNPKAGEYSIKGICANYNIDILDSAQSAYSNINSTDDIFIDLNSLPNGKFYVRITSKFDPDIEVIKDIK